MPFSALASMELLFCVFLDPWSTHSPQGTLRMLICLESDGHFGSLGALDPTLDYILAPNLAKSPPCQSPHSPVLCHVFPCHPFRIFHPSPTHTSLIAIGSSLLRTPFSNTTCFQSCLKETIAETCWCFPRGIVLCLTSAASFSCPDTK